MEETEKKKTVKFSGHKSRISTIVRLCREGGIFTDAELVCDDGTIHAHRIVLGAVSNFLCELLTEAADVGGSVVLMLPGVHLAVAEQLVQFIYTGKMQLSQYNSLDLQQLVFLLEIDPQNVVVDVTDPKMLNLATTQDLETCGIKIKSTPQLQIKPGSQRRPPPEKRPPSVSERRRRTRRASSSDNFRSLGSSPITSPRGIVEGGSSPKISGTVTPIALVTASSRSSSRCRTTSGRGISSGIATTVNDTAQTSRTGQAVGEGPALVTETDTATSNVITTGVPDSVASETTVSSSGGFMSILRPSENSNVIKIVNARKRRAELHHEAPTPIVADYLGPTQKEARTDIANAGLPTSPPLPGNRSILMADLATMVVRGRGRAPRLRGRARSRGGSGVGATRLTRDSERGLHDLRNLDTWVCAICGRYDPVLPRGEELENTTEWIGCDCNRWFHKFCTRLKVVDDNFSCKLVQKTCLVHT